MPNRNLKPMSLSTATLSSAWAPPFLNAPITEIRRAMREIARADGGQDAAEPLTREICHVV